MALPRLYELYGRLRAMRRRGVIFIGSGNIVHALGQVKWDGGDPWDWAAMIASLSLLENDEDVRFFNTDIDLGAVGMRSFISD